MQIKPEYLLIAIIVLFGLHLLMNRCRCNGFSVGMPEYLFQLKNCSDSTAVNDLINLLEDETSVYVDKVDGHMIHTKDYIYMWSEDIIKEQDRREQKCKEHIVDLSELFFPTLGEDEDDAVEDAVRIRILKEIFRKDRHFCESLKDYKAMLFARPKLREYGKHMKQYILDFYKETAGIQPEMHRPLKPPATTDQILKDIVQNECVKKFTVQVSWRFGWHPRNIVIYYDKLVIKELDDSVETTIPFDTEDLEITEETTDVYVDSSSDYPTQMDEPLVNRITINTHIIEHGGRVTITCDEDVTTGESTKDELLCTNSIFNILIRNQNQKSITGGAAGGGAAGGDAAGGGAAGGDAAGGGAAA